MTLSKKVHHALPKYSAQKDRYEVHTYRIFLITWNIIFEPRMIVFISTIFLFGSYTSVFKLSYNISILLHNTLFSATEATAL